LILNIWYKQKQTRKNCFRYLKLMSPLNAAICTTISYTLWVERYYLKNNYLTLRSKVKVPRRSLRHATYHLIVMHPHTKYHWPISKDKNVMVRTRKYYLKTIIWSWGQRSRSHEGHYGMRHTAICSCTHIPNIIDLSEKTKKLWSGQASLGRSGRKNQTKTICLPSFKGET
jgi:acyl-CoA thioesterase FadM